MVTIPIPPVTQPYPSLPLLVFWDSDQQKPCCETGPEQKLALKTKTSVKKMDMYFWIHFKAKNHPRNFLEGLLWKMRFYSFMQ